jgi:GT2 family glycosyltransferase
MLIRVVVVNYNQRELTLRCIESVKRSDWDHELEIVVVDNASSDGSAEELVLQHPDVKVVRAEQNLGFGAAVNRALVGLDRVAYVALLNNDAIVSRNWLQPLVDALESDPSLGAAAPKILFDRQFAQLRIDVCGVANGKRGQCEIRLEGIRLDARNAWNDADFIAGWRHQEYRGSLDRPFRRSTTRAEVLLPHEPGPGRTAQLMLAAESETTVTVVADSAVVRLTVGPEPTWANVPLPGDPVDVINSVGAELVRGGWGADRGTLEIDRGQYNRREEVFAWSGCCAVLRRELLEDVGVFEPRFFLYYEDLDLSWRGWARGWRYVYVPEALVHHRHAASTTSGSALFDHYVERNRLYVHMRNAPIGYALRVLGRYLIEIAKQSRRDVVLPALTFQRPVFTVVGRRLRSLAAFVGLLPLTLAQRRRLRRRRRVPDSELFRWLRTR